MFPLLAIIFISIFKNSSAQFTAVPLPGFHSKTIPNMIYSEIRNSGTETYLSISEGSVYKIINYNVTNSSNPVIAGNYTYSIGQTAYFSYVYFVNGYILASAYSNNVRVFNQSSYAFVGNLTTTDIIGRG